MWGIRFSLGVRILDVFENMYLYMRSSVLTNVVLISIVVFFVFCFFPLIGFTSGYHLTYLSMHKKCYPISGVTTLTYVDVCSCTHLKF